MYVLFFLVLLVSILVIFKNASAQTPSPKMTEKQTKTELAKELAVLHEELEKIKINRPQSTSECEPFYKSSMDAMTAGYKAEGWTDKYYSKSIAYSLLYQNCLARSR